MSLTMKIAAAQKTEQNKLRKRDENVNVPDSRGQCAGKKKATFSVVQLNDANANVSVRIPFSGE